MDINKIDKVVDKLLSEKDYGWDSDPENEVMPEKGERVVKFDFTSGAQDDLEDPHVSGTGKLTGKIVGGQYELEVIDSDNPQVEPGELFYLDDEDIIEVE